MGTIAGFLVVLVLLLFAVEVLIGLYAQTTVGGVAQDAARSVATGRATPAQAEAQARHLLGPDLQGASFTWSVEPDQIAVRVVAHRPRFLPAGWGSGGVLGDIDRTARVRAETSR